MIHGNVFYELTLLLLAAAMLGAVGMRLRQPLILSYLVVGVLAGPSVLGWVTAHDQIDLLAQIGVTLLLFVVGLKLDMHLVRHLGSVALATGLGQLFFTIVIGLLIALALGMEWVQGLYVAVALTFSSTIIIVKLLSDKREMDSLHGRIALGFLIVQDIAVVIAMTVMSATAGGQGLGTAAMVGRTVVILVAALIVITLLMRHVLPRVLHFLARSQELLLLFAVAWGTSLATAGELLGFSKEVGAFLAGFSLASTPYREAVSTRLSSLRDFLLLFFFIDLGAKLDLALLGGELGAALLFSAFVLVGNPLIVMAIMGYMGYRSRTGFLAGLTVAQISEFSIVFVAMGVSFGHVGQSTLGLVTMVGMVTITLSTYMILYSGRLYEMLAPWLGAFQRQTPFREIAVEEQGGSVDERTDVIVYGMGRFGRGLVDHLRQAGVRVMGVDFDPETVAACRRNGLPIRFGDAEDPSFPETLPLARVRQVVCTLPQVEVSLGLLAALAQHGYTGPVIVTAHSRSDAARLRRAGVHDVLMPFENAADFAAEKLARALLEDRHEPLAPPARRL